MNIGIQKCHRIVSWKAYWRERLGCPALKGEKENEKSNYLFIDKTCQCEMKSTSTKLKISKVPITQSVYDILMCSFKRLNLDRQGNEM